MFTLEKLQEVFIKTDPMGLIMAGSEKDIYDRTCESVYRFLTNTKPNATSDQLAYTIQLNLCTIFFNLTPSYEKCKHISHLILQKNA